MIAALLDSLAALPAVVWLIATSRDARAGRGPFIRATIEAVVLSFVLAHVNRWFDLWKTHPYFPSGHETFAACVATALVVRDRRYLIFALVVLVILGYGLVRSGWHGRFEVVAGFILGSVVTLTTLKANGIRI
ncbi:MAG: phosphatase PAP2 family protein [Candidatus Tyrphobacter sp.]